MVRSGSWCFPVADFSTTTERPPMSVGLQQPVDVVELFLRPVLLAGAAAQLIQDLAAALALEFERHLVDAGVDCIAVVAVGAAERMAIWGAPFALLDLGEVLGVARPAIAHLLGHVAQALLQVVEGTAVRARGFARIATLQCFLGVGHGALGAGQRVGHLDAVLVELVHELAELTPQTLLLAALLLAPLALAVARLLALALALLSLLALLTLLPLLAALSLLALATLLLAAFALGFAQKLVLPPRQSVELVHHLAALLVALPLLPALALLALLVAAGHHGRGVFHHLAQLFEQALGFLALAVLRHLADLVEHLLQVVAGDGVLGIHLLRLLLHAAAFLGILHPLGQFLLPAVHGVVELLDQALDLLVAGLALHGIAQLLARLLERPLGIRCGAAFQAHGEIPQELLGVGDSGLVAVLRQACRADAQAELHHPVVAVALRLGVDQAHAIGDVEPEGLGIARQRLAQHDQRARRRIVEDAFGQQEGLDRAAALLAQRIRGEQHHRDLEAGPGMAGEVTHEGIGDLLRFPPAPQSAPHALCPLAATHHTLPPHPAVQADLGR